MEIEQEYPLGFYYNWASDILNMELEDFEHDPSGYLESMGWNPYEWLGKVNIDDVEITRKMVTEFAQILKKYFDRYGRSMEPPEATLATMDKNEVSDFIVNTIAGCIMEAATPA